MDTLTEEQKEYEAMELVKLIDKLNKLGVVQPCRIDEATGKPAPIKHILELQTQKEDQEKVDSDDE